MPLTKTDLQQIGNILDAKLDKSLEPIANDIGVLKKDVGSLKKDVGSLQNDVGLLKNDVGSLRNDIGLLKNDVSYLKKKVNKIDRTLDIVVKNYDEGDVKLAKRVTNIESHLNLASEI